MRPSLVSNWNLDDLYEVSVYRCTCFKTLDLRPVGKKYSSSVGTHLSMAMDMKVKTLAAIVQMLIKLENLQ